MAQVFPVSEAKLEDLRRRMQRLNLREEDFVEDFIRGSGAGGQKINKTSVVVQLSLPNLGLSVRCQEGRSQAMNRFHARRMLVEKLEERIFQEKSRRQQEMEKTRRQKRKRSKRAKAKMLDNKRQNSEKKNLRKRPGRDD